ncbi:MAG: SDR family NAD(P)-dependent oxidoreductase [Egibacteraceae bacterium]
MSERTGGNMSNGTPVGRLERKVALVTGAGSGIGTAIARRFRDEGAVLILNDVNKAAVEAVAEDLDAVAIVADVADSIAVRAMFDQIARLGGRLDILVNNAGISGFEHRAELLEGYTGRVVQRAAEIASGGVIATHLDSTVHTSDEDWCRILAVHVDGTFFCCRAALELMGPQQSGAIINMGSVAGTSGLGGGAGYSAAKGAILGFTRALAREVASRNIRVNALAPGFIAGTNMTGPFSPEFCRVLVAQTPLGRAGEPDDIAWAAVYLASDEAKFVTGQVLAPNGGMYMSQ